MEVVQDRPGIVQWYIRAMASPWNRALIKRYELAPSFSTNPTSLVEEQF